MTSFQGSTPSNLGQVIISVPGTPSNPDSLEANQSVAFAVLLVCQVWQYVHSTCVKHLQKDGYSEVTGIVHIMERGLFLSVGWDKRITTFKDDPDVS